MIIGHSEIDLDDLFERNPDLKEAFDKLSKLQMADVWCKCTPEEQQPVYYEFYDDDGGRNHGWDCSRCTGLIQTG